MEKRRLFILGIVSILVVAVLGFYYWGITGRVIEGELSDAEVKIENSNFVSNSVIIFSLSGFGGLGIKERGLTPLT